MHDHCKRGCKAATSRSTRKHLVRWKWWAVTWYYFNSPFALISDPNQYTESYHNPIPNRALVTLPPKSRFSSITPHVIGGWFRHQNQRRKIRWNPSSNFRNTQIKKFLGEWINACETYPCGVRSRLYIDNVLTLLASFLETPSVGTASPVKVPNDKMKTSTTMNNKYMVQGTQTG